MSIKMARNNAGLANSNLENPSSGGPYVYYETTYTTGGYQEWIYLPDAVSPVKVSVSFTQPGAARLEGTCSPPNEIEGRLYSSTSITAPISYTIVDDTMDNFTALVQGDTAIRLFNAGPGTTISVRC